MTNDSGAESGAKGVVEDIKGKAKEVIGECVGRRTQDARACASRRSPIAARRAKHEAKAERPVPKRRCTRLSNVCTKTMNLLCPLRRPPQLNSLNDTKDWGYDWGTLKRGIE